MSVMFNVMVGICSEPGVWMDSQIVMFNSIVSCSYPFKQPSKMALWFKYIKIRKTKSPSVGNTNAKVWFKLHTKTQYRETETPVANGKFI